MGSLVKNILVYRLGSLGDTVVALPCFHKIKEVYPDAFITLLTNIPIAAKAAPLQAILGEEYFFNKTLNYPVGTRNLVVLIALIKKIRHLNIEAVVNLTTARSKKAMFRDRLFFKAAGVKKLIGFPTDDTNLTPFVDALTGFQEWEASRLTKRIKDLGNINLKDEKYWDLRLNQQELNMATAVLDTLSANKPILAICVGTKRQTNDWKEDNWIELIKKLNLILVNWQLIVIGAADETERADKCLNMWNNEKVNLCGKTSPRVSAAVLKRAAFFIGHDSGPLHLASCVGVPCIAIFSSRNLPGQWYPRGDFNKIIQHITECAGCKLEKCIIQKKKCILSITVEEVLMEVTNLLSTVNLSIC